jgi:hypothetical protein
MPSIYNYHINSAGFRGEEFDGNAEIVALGCSHTFGMGLPSEFAWPNVVSNLMGIKNVANLGRCGASIADQIRWLTVYIRKYGAPKMILASFPNFARYEFCNEKGNLLQGSTEKGFQDCSWTSEQAASQSIDALCILEALCATNSIVLRWQKWVLHSMYMEEQLVNRFKNYVPNKFNLGLFSINEPLLDEGSGEIVARNPGDVISLDCCAELRDISNGCFNYAFDRYAVPKRYQNVETIDEETLSELKRTTLNIDYGRLNAHLGSHAHYHWAKNLVDSI